VLLSIDTVNEWQVQKMLDCK